jgi:hypothetical protein
MEQPGRWRLAVDSPAINVLLRRHLVTRLIASLALLGGMACATTGSGIDSRLEHTFNGSVTGVIVVPEATASADVCKNLNVYATLTDAQQTIGHTSVRQSRNRCSYQIDNLPADRQLSIKVEPAADLKCQDGTPMAFATDAQAPITLKSGEGKLQDFRAQCGATRS